MTRALVAAAVVAAAFSLLFVLERVAPLRRRRRRVLPRLAVNAVVTVSAFVVAGGLIGPATAALLDWTDAAGVGLLEWIELPFAVELALGFLLLDLAFYWWHRANHLLPLLWRFHAAHHLDPDLDVTTAGRFHFGEMLFSVGFQSLQIVVLGVPAATYLAYRVVFEVGTLFHHSNLRLPARLDRALTAIVVTPRMHGVHHSQAREETCSNFSVVFTLWDRLHRTLRLDVPQERITVGVPAYDRPEDNRVGAVLASPFRRQRDYWRAPEPTR